MISSTTIRDMDVYARDISAVKEEPDAENYPLGVKNGWTAPAKWWNWLFNELTTRVGQERADVNAIIDEIKSVLTEASIQPDATNNAQLKAAVLAILQRIAGLNTPGMVKSSDINGQVQVLSSGVMEVNGVGNFADLPSALSSANTLIDAIDILYTQLQTMSIGVPPQPANYDASNPVLNTTALSGDAAKYGEIHLDAGWYFVDMSGGGGGARGYETNATNANRYNGGYGTRSTGWIFVMSPGKYIYGVGSGAQSSYAGQYVQTSRTGNGGTNGLSGAAFFSKYPCYFDGNPGEVNGSSTIGGTGAATVLISCPTQEVYCVSGGSGGNFGVRDYVNLVSAEAYTEAHTEENVPPSGDNITFYGAYAQGESVPASGQLPWGVNGWTKGPGAQGGSLNYIINGGSIVWLVADGNNGWVKIYRGVTATPST